MKWEVLIRENESPIGIWVSVDAPGAWHAGAKALRAVPKALNKSAEVIVCPALGIEREAILEVTAQDILVTVPIEDGA